MRCSWPFVAAAAAILACLTSASADEAALKIIGREGEVIALKAADLKALPRSEFEATERDGTMARYSGVEVSQLLVKAGVPQGEKLRGEWLRAFVAVDASDSYRAVFALPEFDAAFTDRKILLVDTRNGQALDAQHGPFQIAVPDEKRRARWIRMVTEIHIIDSKRLDKTDK